MVKPYLQITLTIVFILTTGGCNSSCRCHQKIHPPTPPKEIRDTRYIYSDRPAIITFAQFQEQLNCFAYQLTLLYLIDADSQYDIDMLRCLTEIQKKFYRYGLRVLIIDLHSPVHWPGLKKCLYQANANYLAEYMNSKEISLLKDFLNFGYNVNNLFAIDFGHNNHIYRLYERECWRIKRKIKSILRDRVENVSN